MRIVLVDDDIELCAMLAEYLATEGFETDTVHDGEAGVKAALSGDYAAVVLDIMMPRLNGIDALRRIRQSSRIPVVMLTAKGDDIDRIVGLELGADDYVPKPCSPRELVARLRAILRRSGDTARPSRSNEPVEFGPIRVYPEQRRAEWDGITLELTSAEFNLLEMLVTGAGRVLTKDALCEGALGRPHTRYDRSVDVHMSNLRQKLSARSGGPSPIQTVRGVGYKMAFE